MIILISVFDLVFKIFEFDVVDVSFGDFSGVLVVVVCIDVFGV